MARGARRVARCNDGWEGRVLFLQARGGQMGRLAESRAGGEEAGGAAVVTFEVAAEVRELGAAELDGDDFGEFAVGEELRGGIHAFTLEEVVRSGFELLLAEALELAQGHADGLRGVSDIPARALGELTPEVRRLPVRVF